MEATGKGLQTYYAFRTEQAVSSFESTAKISAPLIYTDWTHDRVSPLYRTGK